MKAFASSALEIFYKLCEIPHCSFHTQDMFSFLCLHLESQGYTLSVDSAFNIHAKKGKPRICLQGHYDMVCVGDSTKHKGITLIQKDGFLYAKDSSLGADNGIALACMLALGHYDMVCVGDSTKHKGITLIQKDGFLYAKDSSLGADNGIALACMLALDVPDIELLFTNDEEVGMIGANNLNLNIESPLLLNLDSEDLNEIVLGCAGGVDIECNVNLNAFLHPLDSILPSHPYVYKITSSGFLGGHSGIEIHKNKENALSEFGFFLSTIEAYIITLNGGDVYKITSSGFLGGHSGIEIHKNKENALSEFGFFLSTIEAYIITLNGGEKRNSIPVGVEAIIACDERLDSVFYTPNGACFHCEILESSNENNAYHKNAIVPLLCGIHSGVYAGDKQGVLCSLNLSLIAQKQDKLEIVLMARANTQALLERTIKRLEVMLPYLNPHCSMKTSGYYAPWERSMPHTHKALELLNTLYARHNITPHHTQIHAGLECGILKRQILAHSNIKDFEILSIGPTIHAPHSRNECLDLKDFEIFCDILEEFITMYKDA